MSLETWRRPDVWPHVARTPSIAERIDEATEEWWPGAVTLWLPPTVGSALLLLAPGEQRWLASFFGNLDSVTGGWPYRSEWVAPGGDLTLRLLLPGAHKPAQLSVDVLSRDGGDERRAEASLTLEAIAGSAVVWFVEMLPALEPFPEWQ